VLSGQGGGLAINKSQTASPTTKLSIELLLKFVDPTINTDNQIAGFVVGSQILVVAFKEHNS
jgi:hypothetical protein